MDQETPEERDARLMKMSDDELAAEFRGYETSVLVAGIATYATTILGIAAIGITNPGEEEMAAITASKRINRFAAEELNRRVPKGG